MSSKLLVKYLDPNTGKYEYASVVDIGDLDNLKTQVKTDLVSAINSITLSGEAPENIQSQIDGINSQITDLGKAGLTDRQLAEIQIKLDANIVDIMSQVNELNAQVEAELKKDIADLSVDYTSKIEDAQNDYNAKVSEINLNLDEAKSDIVKTKSDLLGIKDELSNSDINYVNVTQDINKINGSLSTKVESSDFDLMQSKVTKNTTDIAQTKENITLLATKSSLDLATERITNAESNIKINSDGIESRVTYEELNSEIQNVNKYGDNMLIGTRNWSAGWASNDLSQSYITNNTYNHCKIQVINRKTGYHSTNVDGLIIGKTYTASVYFKTGSNSTISSPVFFVGNKEYTMDKVVEDTSLINNWKRVSVNFVATEVSFTTSIRFDFISSGDTGYLVSPKLEFGAMATPWKPYFEDDNESIIKNESSIKQNSDSIVSLVKSTTKIGEDVETNKTQITQTSEKVETQAVKIQEIDGKVSENKASIAVANGRIDLKVSQTDVNQSIANTNLDTKNRIINSDFSRGFSNWNEISSGFSLKDIDSSKFASITRSRLTSTSIASIASDKFQVDNGNKLNFNFNFMSLNLNQLDDKNIFTIEIFDINDIRVFSNTFSLNNLNGNTNLANGKIVNLTGKYTINRSDAAKARVKFQINKNGNVNFSKINLQKGDVLDSNWAQAPEDILLYRVESQTAIEQTSKDILLRAKQTDLDTSNSRIKSNESSIKIANDGITQLTTDYNAINGRITKAESSITQNANAITQKVSSTDVENILTGKAYATKSEVVQTSNTLTSTISGVRTDVDNKANQTQVTQLTQNLDGFKTTVSSTYLNKTDATNLYPTKKTVSTQINQSATDITSSVQSWTKGRLNGYSTIKQTDDSITSAVSGKADRSQLIQLSDQITSVVSSAAQNNLVYNATLQTSDGWTLQNGYTQTSARNINGNYIINFSLASNSNNTWYFSRSKQVPIGIRKEYAYAASFMLRSDISNGKTFMFGVEGFDANGSRVESKTTNIHSQLTDEKWTTISDMYEFKNSSVKTVCFTLATNSFGHYIACQPIMVNSGSVGNFVADGMDKSQITQLSDQIVSKVSVGDVTSQINQEAGQILIQAKKLVLNASTTTINGNAFINGSMIVDGSLKAKQISVDNLASINNTLGNVKSANLTNTTTYLDSKKVSHRTVFNVSNGITFKDSYKIGSINNVDNINMNAKDNISIDLTHYEGDLIVKQGTLSPTSLVMKDTKKGNFVEYSARGMTMTTEHLNSSRSITFHNDGIILSPERYNKGKFNNNTGIDLIGMTSFIDFHNTIDGRGKDYVSRIQQSNGEFQLVSENSINLQCKSVNVRNASDSGFVAIFAASFQQQSSKDIKYNIKDLKDGYIDDLKKINFKSYRQVSPKSVYQIGLILEENIEQPFTTKEGVDLYSYVTFIAKALQEEIIKREKLEEEIKEIQNGKKY